MNTIVALPALKDNYIWTIHSLDRSEIIVVDPGDATVVLDYAGRNKLKICAILLTHHHADHSQGILPLVAHFPEIVVYGSPLGKVPGVTQYVTEMDKIKFTSFGVNFTVLAIPGHTLDHLAFYDGQRLFCGDTLFSCGCGRIFEGSPEQMLTSLEKIKNLPKNTQIYCGHEYTADNIRFALHVEPNNKMLHQRAHLVENLRQQNLPTLPVTLASELQTNPFLRCHSDEVIASVQKRFNFQTNGLISIFSHLRKWKNEFSA